MIVGLGPTTACGHRKEPNFPEKVASCGAQKDSTDLKFVPSVGRPSAGYAIVGTTCTCVTGTTVLPTIAA